MSKSKSPPNPPPISPTPPTKIKLTPFPNRTLQDAIAATASLPNSITEPTKPYHLPGGQDRRPGGPHRRPSSRNLSPRKANRRPSGPSRNRAPDHRDPPSIHSWHPKRGPATGTGGVEGRVDGGEGEGPASTKPCWLPSSQALRPATPRRLPSSRDLRVRKASRRPMVPSENRAPHRRDRGPARGIVGGEGEGAGAKDKGGGVRGCYC